MNKTNIEFRRRSNFNNQLFSILIPSWNNIECLKLCISSIQKNSSFSHQIIVHINAGSDGSLDWIENETIFDYTFSKENVGVCYALNASSQLVYTNYIVYMNDDMYACPGWDEALWNEISSLNHNKFFFSGTAIEAVPQSNCSIKGNFGTNTIDFNEKLLLQQFKNFPKEDWMGATWPPNIVHRSMWNMVGGYSVEFSPGMYSDPDFSMKLWLAGIRLFKGISKSRVYHFGSISVNKIKKNKGYYQFINKWGLTSSTFSKKYLHRGDSFSGECFKPSLDRFAAFKLFFKRIRSVILTKPTR